ncbi:MAG: phosphate-starvation-inducible PsiE family protein [Gammaproteobacteria bacterium]|nr:phosphate-starvation-inducible PsiE family protein [Gammaproteobacteria bacterium]
MSPSDRKTPIHRYLLEGIERIGLFGIVIATVIASGQEVQHIINTGKVTLADLLLMFIYLEVIAMVGHYFQSGQLPVRFPLYIGMIALARYLILDMKAMEDWRLVAVSLAILVLGITVLVVRYGHVKYPYNDSPRQQYQRRRRSDFPHHEKTEEAAKKFNP